MATNLLLTYTPDASLKFSQVKRGWPSDERDGSFHPVCNKCDGYGSVWGWVLTNWNPEKDILPPTGFNTCECCDGSGFAKHTLLLNAQEWEH